MQGSKSKKYKLIDRWSYKFIGASYWYVKVGYYSGLNNNLCIMTTRFNNSDDSLKMILDIDEIPGLIKILFNFYKDHQKAGIRI